MGLKESNQTKVEKYCRMLPAILSTFINFKLPFVIKIFVLSIFEWPFTQVLLYVFVFLAVIYIRHLRRAVVECLTCDRGVATCWFEPHWRHCVVSLNKKLSTVSTQKTRPDMTEKLGLKELTQQKLRHWSTVV